MEYMIGFIIFAVIVVAALIYFIWSTAFIMATLWGWFIPPVFGLSPLTLGQAWGISILVNMWTHRHMPGDLKKYKFEEETLTNNLKELSYLILRPWVILLFGWICHRWFI